MASECRTDQGSQDRRGPQMGFKPSRPAGNRYKRRQDSIPRRIVSNMVDEIGKKGIGSVTKRHAVRVLHTPYQNAINVVRNKIGLISYGIRQYWYLEDEGTPGAHPLEA